MTLNLDATGLKCPMPVLRARKMLDSLEDGGTLIMLADDPASLTDMPAYCKMAGHTLLMVDTEGGEYRFTIEKGTGEALETVEGLPRLATA